MADAAEALSELNPPKVTIGQLKTANHLIGDREALQKAWETDGYWYFRGVLDEQVIGRMREIWIDFLKRKGLIDADVNENRYNRSGFADKDEDPASLTGIAEFNERHIHEMLTENPKINATMKEILGDDPAWLPIAEYRANPPVDDPVRTRLIYPHQDGFYSRGIPMKICWIPLDEVDLETGGCAWIGGSHIGPSLHELGEAPLFAIPDEHVPTEGWASSNFEPGDIVIFDLNLVHSGLTNISSGNRFRLTLDIRVVEASGNVPVIGSVSRLTENEVVLRNQKTGEEKTYAINSDTYVRNTNGQRRTGADIPTTFAPHETIIVNAPDGKTATVVRAIH